MNPKDRNTTPPPNYDLLKQEDDITEVIVTEPATTTPLLNGDQAKTRKNEVDNT
jgi:hypothetical protein